MSWMSGGCEKGKDGKEGIKMGWEGGRYGGRVGNGRVGMEGGKGRDDGMLW